MKMNSKALLIIFSLGFVFLNTNGFVLKFKKDTKLQDEDESKLFTNIFSLQVFLFDKLIKQLFKQTSIFLVDLHNV